MRFDGVVELLLDAIEPLLGGIARRRPLGAFRRRGRRGVVVDQRVQLGLGGPVLLRLFLGPHMLGPGEVLPQRPGQQDQHADDESRLADHRNNAAARSAGSHTPRAKINLLSRTAVRDSAYGSLEAAFSSTFLSSEMQIW